ncbi:hypothetical protein [Pseudogracilibacillus sp. SO30301A]|uniref:hypothetical protein n=1 Tax=Pseudogracilibacillus sp. SO30301A TaxID=3098291 RepID=UPI00300E6C7B
MIITPEIRDEEEIDGNDVFRYWENAIYLDIKELRDDERGNYYTYFHEVAHAFDYYYAQDNEELLKEIMEGVGKEIDKATFFTDGFMIDEKILNDYMYEDAENHFRIELAKVLE